MKLECRVDWKQWSVGGLLSFRYKIVAIYIGPILIVIRGDR